MLPELLKLLLFFCKQDALFPFCFLLYFLVLLILLFYHVTSDNMPLRVVQLLFFFLLFVIAWPASVVIGPNVVSVLN